MENSLMSQILDNATKSSEIFHQSFSQASENISSSCDVFVKSHGLGNDFVLIKTQVLAADQHAHPEFSKERLIMLADRRLGIGADQILSIDKNFHVNIWNSDGSNARMCGNGLRTLGKWIFSDKARFNHQSDEVVLTTISGEVKLAKHEDLVKLHMPFKAKITQENEVYFVDIGNPHKIYIVSGNPKNLEMYADTNYNVSCIWLSDGKCHARTWERGAGETCACGSAAFSIASMLDSIGETNLAIHFKHGAINHIKEGDEIVQIGPAALVAIGVLL